jgi:hypothetical protein
MEADPEVSMRGGDGACDWFVLLFLTFSDINLSFVPSSFNKS